MEEKKIANLTRICYGKLDTESSNEKDIKTLSNLYEKGHLTPFELGSMTFYIKAPIYVQRQIMRHRTGTFLEKSLRYTSKDPEFGATDEAWNYLISEEYKANLRSSKPEDARKVLTLDTLTEFIFHMDLRNLMHFFKLRLDKHAQKETREIAKEMFIHFVLAYPITANAFKKKEAELVKSAFNEEEMGTIWPMADGKEDNRPFIPASQDDQGDPGTNGNDVSDDTLIPEEDSKETGISGQSTPMDGAGYNPYNNKWFFDIFGFYI